MSRHLSAVTEIDPTCKRRWTAAIQILECQHKQRMKQNMQNEKDKQQESYFKTIVMTDAEGMKLIGLIFNDHLGHYGNIFRQYHRYKISNAHVVPNDPRFPAVSTYPYKWIINKNTLVEEIQERIPTSLPCSFEFTEFKKLHAYAESDELRNVRGIVLRCLPSLEQGAHLVTRRDIVIVNEEKCPLVITLWSQFHDCEGRMLEGMKQPALIFGLRLKVTTFNSISLSTKLSSGFMINPPVSEELQLRKWYTDHRTEIDELLRTTNYRRNDLLLPYPPDDVIVSIDIVNASSDSLKTAWIKGKLNLSSKQRRFSYTGCANCHKSLEADTTWIVMCPSCRVESEIEAMTRVTVIITDDSGSIEAIMTTPDVEKFIGFSPEDVKVNEEFGMDIHSDIAAALDSSEVIAFIRLYEVDFHGAKETKVSIVKGYKLNEKPSVTIDDPNVNQLPNVHPSSSTTKDIPATIMSPESPPVSSNKDSASPIDNPTTLPTTQYRLKVSSTSVVEDKPMSPVTPKMVHTPEVADVRPSKKTK